MTHDIVRMKMRREGYYEEMRRQRILLETSTDISEKERAARAAFMKCIEEEVAILEKAIEELLDRYDLV